MQLVINTYGSYLQRNGDCFRVKVEERVFDVSVKKVSSIMVTTSAYVTTDAIKMAMDHNIDVVFLDKFGDPFGRVWHSKLGSTTLIRRKQLEIAEKDEGLAIALEWIGNKFQNQIDFLQRLRNTRTHRSAEITSFIEKLKNCKDKLRESKGTIGEKRGTIMGIEGTGGRIYFEALSTLLPDRFKFNGRSRNPAQDEFNALLNYAYGILYSKVEKACIIAGLDPYVGIIHTDHYNKKSMVFDLIENYRIWADETVVKLFASRKVMQGQFDRLKNGLTLNKDGKVLLVEAFNNFLDESIRYKGRNIKRGDIIQFECHRIANGLIERIENSKQ
ncbi:MAG: CRISPR-associated endonuclease Cas1 [Thermodesulfobacteriota bacterium]|nr:CRISPR-associated endonuclease Cas1 [Thermodesulfobacteriota bacterium]